MDCTMHLELLIPSECPKCGCVPDIENTGKPGEAFVISVGCKGCFGAFASHMSDSRNLALVNAWSAWEDLVDTYLCAYPAKETAESQQRARAQRQMRRAQDGIMARLESLIYAAKRSAIEDAEGEVVDQDPTPDLTHKCRVADACNLLWRAAYIPALVKRMTELGRVVELDQTDFSGYERPTNISR
jgi:hypothetical protein